MKLQGKTIVVVGGTSGIGAAVTLLLAARGARLRLFGRRRDELEAQVARIQARGAEASFAVGDTTRRDEVRRAVEAFAAEGGIDGLLFTAGISHVTLPREITAAEAREVFDTNFFGFLHWVEAVLPGMLDRGRGFLAAATAQCAWRGIPCGEAYAASKAALQSYLESLRLDCEPYGVRVVELLPGFVRTPMSDLNNFTQPLMIEPEEAARIVVEGLEGGDDRIPFGRGFARLMAVLRALPDRLYARVFRGFTRGRFDTEGMLQALPPLQCPEHRERLVFDRYKALGCPSCGYAAVFARDHLDLLDATQGLAPEASARILSAYRIYSITYPITALLAMKLVWRGSLRKLVRFYTARLDDAAEAGGAALDVATGDGSLLALALGSARRQPRLLGVDLSLDMLGKASRRLSGYRRKLLLRCDAALLPLPDGAFPRILCFGGVHVFAEPEAVLARLARLLAPDGGSFSGSILCRPSEAAGAWWSDRFIEWGSLANSMTIDELEGVFAGAGLALTAKDWNGSMLLFRARKA